MAKIIAAFRAMDSKQEPFAYSRKSLDSSCPNVLPALPDGTLNTSFSSGSLHSRYKSSYGTVIHHHSFPM